MPQLVLEEYLRDVFTMGARPIATLNSIHFGSPPDHEKTKNLVNGVVAQELEDMEIALEFQQLVEK